MTEADRLLWRALRDYEADLCVCGHPRSEAWDPKNQGWGPDHTGHYDTGAPFRCHACTALAKAQARYAETEPKDVPGTHWQVVLLPRGKVLI